MPKSAPRAGGPANPGDLFLYQNPTGHGYGQSHKSDNVLTAEMTALDLKDGQQVTFVEYNVDTDWPTISWTDTTGTPRITTIDPSEWSTLFNPA
jgi:hypothetical protein